MSPNQEQEYFCDGLAEEIINALAKIKELRVTSRTSSFSFKRQNKSVAEIGEELGVSTLVEGSVRLAKNTIRISTQLIHVDEDAPFWSETFDRELHNIFEIQDEISLVIADKLREHIGHFNLETSLVDGYDISLDTYKKYLKARFYLAKLDAENTHTAIGILKEVVQEAPEFPLCYLDLNQAYTYLGTMGLLPSSEAFMQAQPYLQNALKYGPDLPETQLNLAWISCWQEANLKEAHAHLNRAISQRPSDSMYLTMANFLTLEGKLDTAMLYLEKALELAPFSAISLNYKGFLFYMKEEYEKAAPYFARSLHLQPDLPFPQQYIGGSLLLQDKYAEGLEYFQNLNDHASGFMTKLGGSTLAYAMAGSLREANSGMEELRQYLQTDFAGNASNYLVLCHAQLGEVDKALDYVKAALENGFPLTRLLPTEPLAKPLHKLPAFQKMLKESMVWPNEAEPKRKYKKSLFNQQELETYKKRLTTFMEDDELFLDADLSLKSLAERMVLPPNHMSQLLNEGFHQNFADFVNTYRLEWFKNELKTTKAHHLTLLGLAYDSGFNSKTVFNTFFKKKTGITPKAYWKQVLG